MVHFIIYICVLDSDPGDYDYELSLEMKRQKIQRELLKLEQENLDKREEIVIKKDEAPTKSRTSGITKVNNFAMVRLRCDQVDTFFKGPFYT